MPCQDDPFPEMLHIGKYFHKSVVFSIYKVFTNIFHGGSLM